MKTDASTWWWNQFTDILQVLRLCLFLAIANEGMAQAPDTLAADRPVGDAHYFQRPGRDGLSRAEKQKRVIVKEHIAFTSVNLVLSATESQIIDMENLECNALLKRDTSALKKIWMRDFTLDAPQNDLLLGQNPIP